MLADHLPLAVFGDGNCLYRAISRGLFGHENHHMHIRLLTALEIAEYPAYYDAASPDYIDLIREPTLVNDPYPNLMRSACKQQGWSEILHLYAASAVLQKALLSYCPPVLNEHYLTRPLSRKVCGRGVSSTATPVVKIMWTMGHMPNTQDEFVPSHFVVLHCLAPPRMSFVDLTDSKPSHSAARETSTPRPTTSDKDTFSRDYSFSELSDSQAASDSELSESPLGGIKPTSPPAAGPSPVFTDDTLPPSPAGSDSAPSDHISMDTDYPIGSQGYDLPIPGRFLSMSDLVSVIKSEKKHKSQRIPTGLKQNKYFCFDNTDNIEHQRNGKPSCFWDDCGAWKAIATNKSYVLRGESTLTELTHRQGQYGLMKRQMVDGKSKQVFTVLEQQPPPELIIVVHRAYAVHTCLLYTSPSPRD
eukprot:TRINITY_DN44882_c0_g1_i9.p1 TRINITY_DN44882_c0_g1~~TRINITY_DN44882_c0_g1_i9.p1  ORF type:complete len:484 (-),score=90.89 TRINITY_DN44882_c0_g1_i9:1-1248(-)